MESRPVAEGVIIGLKYAVGIAELAAEYDKPIECVILKLKERLEAEEKEIEQLQQSNTPS